VAGLNGAKGVNAIVGGRAIKRETREMRRMRESELRKLADILLFL